LSSLARILSAFLLVAAASPSAAVSPKYWIHDTAEELFQGEAEGVSVASEGSLRLAPEMQKLASPEVPYVWDVAVSADRRDAFLGTGDDGWILRVRDGETEPYFQCAAFEVLSLAVGPDGALYAGTAPEGIVFRVQADSTARVLFDAEESYVWDLAFGPDGKLYAAVGPEGAVHRIDPVSGNAERFFATTDHHVVCLAFGDHGALFLGTEGRGLVVRVEPDGKARVLHDCPQGEVGAVLPGKGGVVWAAAASAAEVREEARRDNSEQADGKRAEEEDDEFPGEFVFEVTAPGASDAVLYRIDERGNAQRVWSSGHAAIFDLADGPEGSVLCATGEEGAVYAVRPDGRATLLVDAPEDQVVSLVTLGEGRGFLCGTANPSGLFRISEGPGSQGTYTSEVLDAQRVARWGRLEWAGAGSAKFAVRTGNTDEPDDTWSAWTEGPEGASIPLELEPARYFQWRVVLTRGGELPEVQRVRVSSLENNVAPIVARAEVVPSGTRFYDEVPELRPRPLYQELPGGVSVEYQLEQGGNHQLPPEHRAPWTQGLRQVRWESVDPNGDDLVFDLAFRREDETRWKTFAEDVEGSNYTFNGNGVPDGAYRIRLTASDRRSNPGDERSTSLETETFLVDNTAPGFENVEHRRDGDEVRITGRVVDAVSDVIRLEYSVNGEDWVDRAPADGIFDSRSEGIDVEVGASQGEEHSVILRGTDNAGNLGATRVLIRP
jgi:hypothetical protein